MMVGDIKLLLLDQYLIYSLLQSAGQFVVEVVDFRTQVVSHFFASLDICLPIDILIFLLTLYATFLYRGCSVIQRSALSTTRSECLYICI